MKVYISFVILSFLYLYEEFGKFGLALRKWKNETQMPDFYRELPIIRLMGLSPVRVERDCFNEALSPHG